MIRTSPSQAGIVGWPLPLLLAIAATLTAVTAAGPALHLAYGGWVLMLIYAVNALGILIALALGERLDQRSALIVILGGAILMRLSLLFLEPYLSTDIYRYIWDGRVQAAGINPYRYVPMAPELAHLRDTVIFPNINRADHAVTIYPPVAQAVFLTVTRLGESVVAMKLGLIACEAGMVAILLALLSGMGGRPIRIVAYAWHPLPIWEIAGSGHVDIVMCMLLMAGLLLFLHRRALLAGTIVTLGALVKPTALLALPVFWRPWDLRLPVLVVLTGLLVYLPYLSVGSGVFGYLLGYLDEEGLLSGRGYSALWLLERFTGHVAAAASLYVAVAAASIIYLAILVGFRKDRSPQMTVACLRWLLVVFLVLASPHYPWYFLVLTPLLVLQPSASGWLLTLAAPILYDSTTGTAWPNYDARVAALMFTTLAALAHDARKLRGEALDWPWEKTDERPRDRTTSLP